MSVVTKIIVSYNNFVKGAKRICYKVKLKCACIILYIRVINQLTKLEETKS